MCLSRCRSQTNSVKEESASEADFAIVAILDASVAATSQLHMFQPYRSEKLVVLFVSFFFSFPLRSLSHWPPTLLTLWLSVRCAYLTPAHLHSPTLLCLSYITVLLFLVCLSVCVRVRKSTHVINV